MSSVMIGVAWTSPMICVVLASLYLDPLFHHDAKGGVRVGGQLFQPVSEDTTTGFSIFRLQIFGHSMQGGQMVDYFVGGGL